MVDIERARQLRKIETWAEKLVWSRLRDRRFTSHKFRRQHPVGIYFLIFFCEEAEQNVEVDGSQHGFPGQRKHDLEREKFLQSRGIKTLRFWNSYLRREAEHHAAFARTRVINISTRTVRSKSVSPLPLCHRSPNWFSSTRSPHARRLG